MLPLPIDPVHGYALIKRFGEIKQGQTVVELSSGPIPYYERLKSAIGPTGQLIVSDLFHPIVKDAQRYERAISIGKRIVGKKVMRSKPVVLNNIHLPFRSGSVDRVVASRTIEMNWKEIVRVLKKNGKLVLLDYVSKVLSEQLAREFGNRVKIETGFDKAGIKSGAYRCLVLTKLVD